MGGTRSFAVRGGGVARAGGGGRRSAGAGASRAGAVAVDRLEDQVEAAVVERQPRRVRHLLDALAQPAFRELQNAVVAVRIVAGAVEERVRRRSEEHTSE